MKIFILLLLLLFGTSIFSDKSYDSVYTDFSKDCAYPKEESIPEGSDGILVCKDKFGYTAMITYSACMEFLRILSKDGKEIIELPAQPIGSVDHRKLEWRTKNALPIGIIYRNSILKSDTEGNCPSAKTKEETLEIRGLGKYSKFKHSIPVKVNANEKARKELEDYVTSNAK